MSQLRDPCEANIRSARYYETPPNISKKKKTNIEWQPSKKGKNNANELVRIAVMVLPANVDSTLLASPCLARSLVSCVSCESRWWILTIQGITAEAHRAARQKLWWWQKARQQNRAAKVSRVCSSVVRGEQLKCFFCLCVCVCVFVCVSCVVRRGVRFHGKWEHDIALLGILHFESLCAMKAETQQKKQSVEAHRATNITDKSLLHAENRTTVMMMMMMRSTKERRRRDIYK